MDADPARPLIALFNSLRLCTAQDIIHNLSILSTLIPRIYLLLQHDTVNASLQQGKHQTCLPLQLAQAIQYLGRGFIRHCIQETR